LYSQRQRWPSPGLNHHGEQFRVEEFIPGAAIEEFSKIVLARRDWLDVGGWAHVFTPTPQSLSDVFGALV